MTTEKIIEGILKKTLFLWLPIVAISELIKDLFAKNKKE
jgi:hypothetical protein